MQLIAEPLMRERVIRWNALLAAPVAASPGVQVLDLNHQLAPPGKFAWSVAGVGIRSDGVHLTPTGGSWLAPWLLARLRAEPLITHRMSGRLAATSSPREAP